MRNRTRIRTAAFLMLTMAFVMMSGCQSVDPLDEYRDQGAPIISGISHESAIIGTLVTLIGEGFLDEQGDDGKVNIFCAMDGSAVEAVIEQWSDNQIYFRIPTPGAMDARYMIEVTNNNGVKCPNAAYISIISGISSAITAQ